MKISILKIMTVACMMQTAFSMAADPSAVSLNGEWRILVDPYDKGRSLRIQENRKPEDNTRFVEYSFEHAPVLTVPGDWNSQMERLYYYEGTVWYARHFYLEKKTDGAHYFLHFGGVSNRCNVFLNGKKVGSHEGAFTSFDSDASGLIREGENLIVVEVNNQRRKEAIPALSFDWWNYGGITRDVELRIMPEVYIKDYFIQLDKHAPDIIHASVTLSQPVADGSVTLSIPELKVNRNIKISKDGTGSADFKVKKLERWSPENPRLYRVNLTAGDHMVSDSIGFRNIEVSGTQVLLNQKPIFLKSVAIHEEIAPEKRRACSAADAAYLLNEVRDLGANMVRLAHYQQNEHIVRLAEKMGIMVWQEIPVWQDIDFGNDSTYSVARRMLRETIGRDKNRCANCFWGIANETKNTPERNRFLKRLLEEGKSIDSTRLYVAAFDLAYFDRDSDKFVMEDDFYPNLDIVGINKYMGWYAKWPKDPGSISWDVAAGKPLFISEFGGEATQGVYGNADKAYSWSEDYQAQLYRDNLAMFANIPNLCGISPWVLFDFRSPYRMNTEFQQGWNRKGLVSDGGRRKKAWKIIHDYYKNKR